jgi:F-type H+-transporting ATPase subunit b
MFTPEAMAGYAVTAILTIVNLLVTYYVLKRFLFKPILKILRKRKLEVETELAQAEEKLTDAESKLASATEPES